MSRHLLFIFAVVIVAIWAETFVSSKLLLIHGMMPADIFFYRFAIAYVGLILLSHRNFWAKSVKDEVLMIMGGITGGSVYFLTENMALKLSAASNVAILIGTTPMMTALLVALFYRDERMTRTQVIGSLIAFAGLTLVVLNGQLVLHLNPAGDALALTASILWGVYSLCMKVLSRRYEAGFITRKVFGYGLITIIPWFIWVEPLQISIETLRQPVVWGNILWLSLAASLFCYLAWNWIMPRLGVVRATNIVYTQSAFTMAIAAIVLGERITPMAVCGLLVLICGMLLITKREKRTQ